MRWLIDLFKKKDFNIGDIVFYNDEEIIFSCKVKILKVCKVEYEVETIGPTTVKLFWSKRLVNRFGALS